MKNTHHEPRMRAITSRPMSVGLTSMTAAPRPVTEARMRMPILACDDAPKTPQTLLLNGVKRVPRFESLLRNISAITEPLLG